MDSGNFWEILSADTRIHGTTREAPIARFAEEQRALIPTCGQPSFALAGRRSRIVASDYLVSFETNRYSVPFALIGQTVEVERHAGHVVIYHRGRPVAHHAAADGKYQFVQRPEHGPGAVARTARRRFAPAPGTAAHAALEQVEIRDLACYERLAQSPLAAVSP